MFHKLLLKSYLCATLIMVVCMMPGSSLPHVTTSWVPFDKLIHFIMYVPLTWLLAFAFKEQDSYPLLKRKPFLFAFVISSFYGGFIEVLQHTVTADRAADVYDLLADALGAVFAIFTYSVGEVLIKFWNKIFRR